jgi:lipoate-protein ligase A
MNNLRLIDDPARDGGLNMAIDDFLARHAIYPDSPIALRLYSWSLPTLSCGYHQKVEQRVDFERCRRNGVEVARRPTGGRELLHDRDLSFSFVAPLVDKNPASKNAREIFFMAGEVIALSLQEIGIPAAVSNGRRRSSVNKYQPCLAAVSQYEIVFQEKKIVPVAQRIYHNSILVHGSIPLFKSDIDTAELLKTNRLPAIQDQISRSSTTVYEVLGGAVDSDCLKSKLIDNFKRSFKGKITDNGLSGRELIEANNSAYNWKIKVNHSSNVTGR